MTQEEKDLLFKDLCARAPYKVQVLEDIDKEFDGGCIGEVKAIFCKNSHIYTCGSFTPMTIEEIRPYLRPMSSMTEKEKKEYMILYEQGQLELLDKSFEAMKGNPFVVPVCYSCIDYLNSHHFDYRGLIEKGLALEASEGMYVKDR